MRCLDKLPIELKNHQVKAAKYLMQNNINGLLVCHPTGFGKTITALAFSVCFLDKFPASKIIFVGPVGVLEAFKKYLVDFELNLDQFEVYSYQKFHQDFENNLINCVGKGLIIDEAHNLRNMKLNIVAKMNRAGAVLECSGSARKRLLLTATPFVNELEDFIALINFIHGGFLIYRKSQLKNAGNLYKFLDKRIYYIPPNTKNSQFPDYEEHYISINMPRDYEKDYCQLIRGKIINQSGFTNPAAFYNAHRRAVNKIGRDSIYFSLKIDKTIELIGDHKGVIYSNWLEYGIDPLKKALDKKKKNYQVYTGSLTQKKKKEIINNFNMDNFQILILSSSGKEGLDLKGVRKLVVMDPVWNFSGMEQIKGRAIRYQSHTMLPPEEQFVDIYYLLLRSNTKGCISGDSVVYKFIRNKKAKQKIIDKIMASLSI